MMFLKYFAIWILAGLACMGANLVWLNYQPSAHGPVTGIGDLLILIVHIFFFAFVPFHAMLASAVLNSGKTPMNRVSALSKGLSVGILAFLALWLPFALLPILVTKGNRDVIKIVQWLTLESGWGAIAGSVAGGMIAGAVVPLAGMNLKNQSL